MPNLERIVSEVIKTLDENCEDLSKHEYLEVLEELHSNIGGRIDATENELEDEENPID